MSLAADPPVLASRYLYKARPGIQAVDGVIIAAVGFDAFSRGESLAGLRRRLAVIRLERRTLF